MMDIGNQLSYWASGRRLRTGLFVLLATVGLFTMAAQQPSAVVWAASPYQVNSIADTPDVDPGDGVCTDNSGKCTLRAALEEIGASGTSDAVNKITFSPSLSGTIALTSHLPDIGSDFTAFDLAIVGPGADRLTIDGGGVHRPFYIEDYVSSVSIYDLTIANGLAGDGSLLPCESYTGPVADVSGGAIYSQAELYLDNVVLLHNEADFRGGSIFNVGTLDLTDVDIIGNASGCDGGGIYNQDDGFVTLTDSLVRDNYAYGDGGGIYAQGSSGNDSVELTSSTVADNGAFYDGGGILNLDSYLDLTNSTVSGNDAGGHGGGIVNRYSGFGAQTRVASSTITDNNADGNGGGIVNQGGADPSDAIFEIKNSIVAGNRNADGLTPDCAAQYSYTFTSDHTLVGDNSGCETDFVDGVRGNLVGGKAGLVDPVLGRLAYNGGATPTHALLSLAAGQPGSRRRQRFRLYFAFR